MNTKEFLSLRARRAQVGAEVRNIKKAWPQARVTRGHDGLTAVAIIPNPTSTYVVEVTPVGAQSLHIPHDASRTATGHPPQWREGWVD